MKMTSKVPRSNRPFISFRRAAAISGVKTEGVIVLENLRQEYRSIFRRFELLEDVFKVLEETMDSFIRLQVFPDLGLI